SSPKISKAFSRGRANPTPRSTMRPRAATRSCANSRKIFSRYSGRALTHGAPRRLFRLALSGASAVAAAGGDRRLLLLAGRASDPAIGAARRRVRALDQVVAAENFTAVLG